jgi:hypothetical protein
VCYSGLAMDDGHAGLNLNLCDATCGKTRRERGVVGGRGVQARGAESALWLPLTYVIAEQPTR